ncbi:MAG: helicase-related protein, partial [Leucothrix sp.]
IKARTATAETIRQRYWKGKTVHKLDALTRIFEAEPFDGILIFVRTKSMTHELGEKLEARGYATTAINGDIKQELREKTIEQFRRGKIDIMIATDVVARGLDVERISHVINYDMPHDTESYVHRIGRTGRAGREGTAILFIPPRGERMLKSIERATGQEILPFKLPTAESISETRITRFKQQISDIVLQQDLDFLESVVGSYANEGDLSIEKIAAALAWLAQKDRPLSAKQLDIPSHDTRPDRNRKDRDTERPSRSRDRNESPRTENKRSRNKDSGSTEALPDMVTYRLEVGAEHGVEAKHIVGAIANEAGVDSAFIRNLSIEGDHSTVELPDGMPKPIFKHLQKLWVQGQQLQLRQLTPKGDTSTKQTSEQPKEPRRDNADRTGKGSRFTPKGTGSKRAAKPSTGDKKPRKKKKKS